MSAARVTLDDFNAIPAPTASEGPTIVTLAEFIAIEEPGAEALVGDAENALVAEGSNVMFYGDGGAGKTTLTLDASCHLAAGDDWLGMTVARPVRVLVIENEGPRALFRTKLRRKAGGWQGSPLDDRLLFWEEPWATFTFADERDERGNKTPTSDRQRQQLATAIRDREVDVVVIGPVTASGMEDAGTLQDVRAFTALLDDVRTLSSRRLTFVLVHHENKGGKVSGAWEGCGDTLLHVQAQGHGRTRVYVQKARWASEQHGTTMQLVWSDGDSFTLDDKPEVTEDTMAEGLVVAARLLPGGSWTQLRALRDDRGDKFVRGNSTEAAKVRDRLLEAGELVNTATREGNFNLFCSDDPAVTRSDLGTGQERLPGALPKEGRASEPFPVPALEGTGERNGTAEREPTNAETAP